MNTTEAGNIDALRMAALEEGLSVTAGSLDAEAFYRRVDRQRAISRGKGSPLTTVFGHLINMARRERALTLQQLADEIGIDALELLQIEEGKEAPEPRVVSKLARTLNIPPGRLMQLAGHVPTIDKKVETAAYEFAAHANSRPLEPDELEALHEFVKVLASV